MPQRSLPGRARCGHRKWSWRTGIWQPRKMLELDLDEGKEGSKFLWEAPAAQGLGLRKLFKGVM